MQVWQQQERQHSNHSTLSNSNKNIYSLTTDVFKDIKSRYPTISFTACHCSFYFSNKRCLFFSVTPQNCSTCYLVWGCYRCGLSFCNSLLSKQRPQTVKSIELYVPRQPKTISDGYLLAAKTYLSRLGAKVLPRSTATVP